MADVFVTLAAPWDGHQIGDKVRVTEVQSRQLRRGGIAAGDAPSSQPRKAAPAKKAAAAKHNLVKDGKPDEGSGGSS